MPFVFIRKMKISKINLTYIYKEFIDDTNEIINFIFNDAPTHYIIILNEVF